MRCFKPQETSYENLHRWLSLLGDTEGETGHSSDPQGPCRPPGHLLGSPAGRSPALLHRRRLQRSQLGLGCAPPPTRLRLGPLPRGRPGAGPAEAARPPGFGPQRPGRARSHLLTQPRAVPWSMINRPRSAHQETRAVRESGAGPDGGGGVQPGWSRHGRR